MQYYVIAPDGTTKYGPADVETLKGWVAENRLGPDTMLEDFQSGMRLPASQVRDLFPEPVQPQGTMAPGTMSPAGASGYERPQFGSMDDGRQDVNQAFIYAVAGFCCCWPIFCPLGIAAANRAIAKGNPGGKSAKIVNWIVIGLGAAAIAFYAIAFLTGNLPVPGSVPPPAPSQ
jgi:hypothetical protein